jgi:hypothetical protein
MKAIDAEGNKVFTVADKATLRSSVDANVLARLANQIMGGNSEELEKN